MGTNLRLFPRSKLGAISQELFSLALRSLPRAREAAWRSIQANRHTPTIILSVVLFAAAVVPFFDRKTALESPVAR